MLARACTAHSSLPVRVTHCLSVIAHGLLHGIVSRDSLFCVQTGGRQHMYTKYVSTNKIILLFYLLPHYLLAGAYNIIKLYFASIIPNLLFCRHNQLILHVEN